MELLGLPVEIIHEIFLYFDYPQILKTCTRIRQFSSIYGDPIFWKRKIRYTFPKKKIGNLEDNQRRPMFEFLIADQIDEEIEKLREEIHIGYKEMLNMKLGILATQRPKSQEESSKIGKRLQQMESFHLEKAKKLDEKIIRLRGLAKRYRQRSVKFLPQIHNYQYIEFILPYTDNKWDSFKDTMMWSELDYLILNRKLKELGLIESQLRAGSVVGVYELLKETDDWPSFLVYIGMTQEGEYYLEITRPRKTKEKIPSTLGEVGLERLKNLYNFPFNLENPPESEDNMDEDLVPD